MSTHRTPRFLIWILLAASAAAVLAVPAAAAAAKRLANRPIVTPAEGSADLVHLTYTVPRAQGALSKLVVTNARTNDPDVAVAVAQKRDPKRPKTVHVFVAIGNVDDGPAAHPTSRARASGGRTIIDHKGATQQQRILNWTAIFDEIEDFDSNVTSVRRRPFCNNSALNRWGDYSAVALDSPNGTFVGGFPDAFFEEVAQGACNDRPPLYTVFQFLGTHVAFTARTRVDHLDTSSLFLGCLFTVPPVRGPMGNFTITPPSSTAMIGDDDPLVVFDNASGRFLISEGIQQFGNYPFVWHSGPSVFAEGTLVVGPTDDGAFATCP